MQAHGAKPRLPKGRVSTQPMAEYEQVRCIFCTTGYERQLAQAIERERKGKAIFPTRIKRVRIARGLWHEERVPLMPGYVFVYSDQNLSYRQVASLPHVIRVLRYKDEPEGWLRGSDRAFADQLWACGGVIKVLRAVREGSRVTIIDGVFKALNGRVMAMDKRKQAAKIELEVAGNISHVWLSFEYLSDSGE